MWISIFENNNLAPNGFTYIKDFEVKNIEIKNDIIIIDKKIMYRNVNISIEEFSIETWKNVEQKNHFLNGKSTYMENVNHFYKDFYIEIGHKK